jgi:hypothetical protein
VLYLNLAGPSAAAARAVAASPGAAGANRKANFADLFANLTAAPADTPDVGRKGPGHKTPLPAAADATAAGTSTTDDPTAAAVLVIDVAGLLTVPVLDPAQQRPGPDIGDGRGASEALTPAPPKAARDRNDSRSLLSRELSGMTLVEPRPAAAPAQAATPASVTTTAPPPVGTLTFVRAAAASGVVPAVPTVSPPQTGGFVFKPRLSPAGLISVAATEIAAISPSLPGGVTVATASSPGAASIATPLGKADSVVAWPPTAATSLPPPAPQSVATVPSTVTARALAAAMPLNQAPVIVVSAPQAGAAAVAAAPPAAAALPASLATDQELPLHGVSSPGSGVRATVGVPAPAPNASPSLTALPLASPTQTAGTKPEEVPVPVASPPPGATLAVQSSPPTGAAAVVSSPDREGAANSASRDEVDVILHAPALVPGQAAGSDPVTPQLLAGSSAPLSSPADASVTVSSLTEAGVSHRTSMQPAASSAGTSVVMKPTHTTSVVPEPTPGRPETAGAPAAAVASPVQGAGVPVVPATHAGMLPDPAPTHAEPPVPGASELPRAVDVVIAPPPGTVDATAPIAASARPGLGKVASPAAAGPAFDLSGASMPASSEGAATTTPLAGSGQSGRDESRGGRAQPHPSPSTPATVAHDLSAFHVAPVPASPGAAAAPMAAAGASAPVTPADGAELVPQIVQAVKLQWNGDIGEAHLRLRPDYLGELTVSIHVDGGVVTATLASDLPTVREWLQRHESLLRQGLADQGLQLDRLVVAGEAPGRERETSDRPPPEPNAESDQPSSGEKQSPRRPRSDEQTFEVVL